MPSHKHTGHHNYKYFCLFLNYLSIFLIAIIGMTVPFIKRWAADELPEGTSSQIAIMGVVASVFMLMVGRSTVSC
jgi:hypothetical protein